MTATLVNLTFDLLGLIGDNLDPLRTQVEIRTNLEDGAIIDADGNKIYLGNAKADVAADGTGQFAGLVATNSATNPTDFQYQVTVRHLLKLPQHKGNNGWRTWSSGWFSLTADADLADVVAEQYVPPTYVNSVTQQLDAKVTEASGYAADAAASAQQAHDISNIDTSDGVVTALQTDPASAFSQAQADAAQDPSHPLGGALTTTYATVVSPGPSNGTDDTAGLNAALTSGAGKVVRGIPGQTYLISAPLIIQSGTTLDMTGCTVRLKAGSDCRMLQNQNCAGPSRDSGIAVVGGKWDRGANGGVGNAMHSLFLRKIDGVRVENLAVQSTGGKYAVAFGDVTNYVARSLTLATSSDGVHITGPAVDGLVEKITGSTGDDAVGVTTTDYTTYDDVHGSVSRLTVRDVAVTNPTRAVLLATSANLVADGFTITEVLCENITQLGTGSAIQTGTGAASGYVDMLTLRKIRGQVVLRHTLHKTVTVEASTLDGKSLIIVSPDPGMTTNTVEHLIVRGCKVTGTGGNVVIANNSVAAITSLDMSNCRSTASPLVLLNCNSVGRLALRDCVYEGASSVLTINGATTVADLSVSGLRATIPAGYRVLELYGTAAITAAAFDNLYVTAADTNSGDVVYKTGGTLGTLLVANSVLTGTRGILQNSATGTVDLLLSNVRMSGCNRIAQGPNPFTVTYSGLMLSGQINPPFYVSGGASLTVRGSGLSGYTASAVARATTEVIRVVSAEFPADVTILAKNSGDACTNTNAAHGSGLGRVISDGSTWKNVFTGASAA